MIYLCWCWLCFQVPLWRFQYFSTAFVFQTFYKRRHPLVQRFPPKPPRPLQFLSGFPLLPGQFFFWYRVDGCNIFHLHERHVALDVASVSHRTRGFGGRRWRRRYRPTPLHRLRSITVMLGFAGAQCPDVSHACLCVPVLSDFLHGDADCGFGLAHFHHHHSSLLFCQRVPSLLEHFTGVAVLFVQHAQFLLKISLLLLVQHSQLSLQNRSPVDWIHL